MIGREIIEFGLRKIETSAIEHWERNWADRWETGKEWLERTLQTEYSDWFSSINRNLSANKAWPNKRAQYRTASGFLLVLTNEFSTLFGWSIVDSRIVHLLNRLIWTTALDEGSPSLDNYHRRVFCGYLPPDYLVFHFFWVRCWIINLPNAVHVNVILIISNRAIITSIVTSSKMFLIDLIDWWDDNSVYNCRIMMSIILSRPTLINCLLATLVRSQFSNTHAKKKKAIVS